MQLNSILGSHKKLIRKLEYLWPSLVNPKNFLIPETIEEYKQFGIFAPHIRMKPYGECFFNERTKPCLRDFTNTLYQIPQIKDSVSYNLVYQTAISFIERAVSEPVNHSIKVDSEKDIINLIQSLVSYRTPFQFYRIVEGIKLEGIESLMMGDVEIFVYTEVKEKELQVYREHNNERGFFDEYVVPFVKKHFLNRVCIRAIAVGDKIKAEEIAFTKIKQVLNILRFIEVCKYAVWSVLTCLELRTKGYKKLEQIRMETERLFKASMRHAELSGKTGHDEIER